MQSAKHLKRATTPVYFSNLCAKYAPPGYEFVVFLGHVNKILASCVRILHVCFSNMCAKCSWQGSLPVSQANTSRFWTSGLLFGEPFVQYTTVIYKKQLLDYVWRKELGGVLLQSAKSLGRATTTSYFSNTCTKYAPPKHLRQAIKV